MLRMKVVCSINALPTCPGHSALLLSWLAERIFFLGTNGSGRAVYRRHVSWALMESAAPTALCLTILKMDDLVNRGNGEGHICVKNLVTL